LISRKVLLFYGMSDRLLSLSTLLLILASVHLQALQIHDFDGNRHYRFVEGTFPAAPVQNGGLWARTGDLSGVGWSANDSRMGFALISPQHFVGANHFRPSAGSQIRFRAADGQIRSYTYARFYNIKNEEGENTDIFIGELAEPIPASHLIPFYPVYNASELVLVGREILVYGRGDAGPRIGRGVIRGFGNSLGGGLNDTRNYSFEYVQRRAQESDAHGETGDSGSPSFIEVDGMLTVTGVHSAIAQSNHLRNGTTVTTFDSFLLPYRDQIDTHLAHSGYRLTMAPLGAAHGLRIAALQREGKRVTLHLENPAELPYDVQRSEDLLNWITVETSRTGATWAEDLPNDGKQVFWRLVRYSLPVVTNE
jgi:hypothetical protein